MISNFNSAPFWKQAEDCLEQFDYEGAVQVYRNALRQHANDPVILDALGDTLLQMGEVNQARQTLSISIKLAPEVGAAKYMNMGQILYGKESLRHYEKGLELLMRDKDNSKDEEERQSIVEQIVSGLGAMVEIYMTDECFDDNAEPECDRLLSEALRLDPSNPEPLQLMASFKISQQNPEEALKYLILSKDTWINRDVENMPSYEFRIQTAKLFIELQQMEPASEVLDLLLEEYDDNAEIWYLAGYAYSFYDPEAALDCLTRARKKLVKQNCADPQIFEQVDTCLHKVNQMLAPETQNPQEIDKSKMDTE